MAVGLLAFSAGCGGDSSDNRDAREAEAVAEFTAELADEGGPVLFVSPRAALSYTQTVCFDAEEDRPSDERGEAVVPFCSDGWLLGAPLGLAADEWP